MNVLAIKGSDEGLIQLGDDGVGSLVPAMLNGLHLADPHSEISGIGEDGTKQFGSIGEIGRKFGKQLEKFSIAGDEAHC